MKTQATKVAQTISAPETETAVRPHYLEALHLVERLHRLAEPAGEAAGKG